MTDLRTLTDDEWLGDIGMAAWRELLTRRGGCQCFKSAPCFACTEQPTEEELNAVGFTYEPTSPEGEA